MLNQLKSDVYKLVHQRLLAVLGWATVAFLVLFVVLSLSGTALTMGAWVGEQGGEPVASGFMGFVYADADSPRFWEVAYSATALAGLTWLIFLVLSTLFVSSEFSWGTIKLSVAHGIGIFRVYFSKWVVVAFTTVVVSFLFNAVTFVLSCLIAGFGPSGAEVAAWAGLVALQTLVLVVLTLLCFTLFVLTRSVVVVMGIVPIFMFAAVFFYATTAQDRSGAAQAFMNINPMYYLTEASRYWVDGDVTVSVLTYSVIGIPLMLGLSWFVLSRRELP